MQLKRIIPANQAPAPETENPATDAPDAGPAQDE